MGVFKRHTEARRESNEFNFEIDPSGQASINPVFIPSTRITNFPASRWRVTPDRGISPGDARTTVNPGSLVTNADEPTDIVANIPAASLDAGFYVFRVTGAVLDGDAEASCSGNLTTRVPEPATLGLLSRGLPGAGIAQCRRS